MKRYNKEHDITEKPIFVIFVVIIIIIAWIIWGLAFKIGGLL